MQYQLIIHNKLILQGRFFPSLQFLCCIQRNPSRLISKQLGRKDFSVEQVSVDSYMFICKQKNSISINQQILTF